MIGDKSVEATNGSTAIGGNNSGLIINAGTVNIAPVASVARALPSFLAQVIAFFSTEGLVGYGAGERRELPPEVLTKVQYNNLPQDHPVLVDHRRHGFVLEQAYQGIEQQNADARYLVRRRTAVAYKSELHNACGATSTPINQYSSFAIANSAKLIESVIQKLLDEYTESSPLLVESEIAHLAVSLVVADAIVECDVLERPPHAPAP